MATPECGLAVVGLLTEIGLKTNQTFPNTRMRLGRGWCTRHTIIAATI